jgi:hypothetical protein
MVLWTPAAITTALWLDAQDGSTMTESSGAISQWDDKSGNDIHVTQSGAQKPTLVSTAIQGYPGVRFNGAHFFTLPTALIITENLSWFQVFRRPSIAIPTFSMVTSVNNGLPYAPYWFTDNNRYTGVSAATNAAHGASSATGDFLWSYIRNSSNSCSLYQDGTLISTQAAGAIGSGGVNDRFSLMGRRGNTSTVYCTGDFGEIVVIPTETRTEDRQLIEGYLAHKWGLVGNLPTGHPYKDAPPATSTMILAIPDRSFTIARLGL